MSLKSIVPFVLGFLMLAACSGKSKSDLEASVSAFMNKNEKVIMFGKVDYFTILEKAEYKNVPKLGKLLGTELDRLDNSLNTKTPVYFALEGTLGVGQEPSTVYAFLDVKNRDSLADRLSSSGLFVEEINGMKYSAEGDMSIGIKENLAILIVKNEKYDGKALLKEAFQQTKGNVAGGKIDQLLATEGDIVMSTIMQNMYTANSMTGKMDATKQKEWKAMLNDSYTNTTLNFEKGKITFKTESMFSDAMQKRMFFKEDKNAGVIKNLGKGYAKAGFAVNFDMAKFEKYLDDFAPEAKQAMLNSSSEATIAVMMLGDNPLTKLFSGVAGMVLVGEPGVASFIPEINFNVGIGKEGKALFETAMLEAGDKMEYKITDTDLIGKTPNAGGTATKLTLPDCAKDFGKEGVTGFVDFQALNVKGFGLPMQFNALNLIQNITFKANNKNGEFVINFINKDQNVLKQIVDLYAKEMEMLVGNFSL